MKNTKEQKRKARGSISNLKEEKRDSKVERHEAKSFGINSAKYVDRSVTKVSCFDAKIKTLELKKKEAVKNADSSEKKKIKDKYDKRIRNFEIKKVDWLNKHAKGDRFKKVENKDVLINLSGVTKSYTTKSLIFNALNNIDLSIKKGEFVVILGPSGSGKTTLLNMISGLDSPTYGDVVIEGINISTMNNRELTRFRRNKIGFVFQSYNLLSTLNVIDNVDVGKILQGEKAKRLDGKELLNQMNMGQQYSKRIFDLSGGQEQRVSVARALSKNPDILIGDEPTGALDSTSGIEVLKLFQEVNKKYNTTIIIVTHNKNIAEIADKVIHVRDSKIQKIQENSKPKPAEWLATIE